MIEKIRTFFGRVRGQHENKRTVVTESVAWYCAECKVVMVDVHEAMAHEFNCKGNEKWKQVLELGA